MSNNNAFWWIALVLWTGASTWWHTCKIKLLCDEPVAAATPPGASVDIPPLHIMDGAELMLQAPGNFSFARSGFSMNLSRVQSEIDSLARYLKAHPDKKVVLTGYYSASETNSSPWPDLGIARAEELKAYYVKMGIPPDVFLTKSALRDDLIFSADSLRGGLDFSFTTAREISENALAAAQKFETIFKPLDLYFNTGSVDYIKTEDNAKFLEETKKYLTENPGKKLLLTGHTDNVGKPAKNMKLSQERAGEVKKQLVAAGLPEGQLAVDAKGQTQPKASNTTEEGRAANRRVSIVVQ